MPQILTRNIEKLDKTGQTEMIKREFSPPARGLYRHYKGQYYEVLDTALHTETLEAMVVYKGLYEHPEFGYYSIWTRPLEMFLSQVELEDGSKVDRFTFIGPPK
jgi:hypothetical protein